MKASDAAVSALLFSFARKFRGFGKQRPPVSEELPLRSELFSADQMELYGGILAASHELAARRGTDQLLARLDENENILFSVCSVLTEAVSASHSLTPAGEWLFDNFYLIEEQIRIAKRHLPKDYSRELPILAHGPSANLPRVYDIALQAISHGDGRVDTESLRRFVAAYQGVSNLQLGELWAIPIMLRLALIENLRRVAVYVSSGHTDRNLAAAWAAEITRIAENDPKSLVLVIADMARSDPPMSTPFVSELARRLQGQGPSLALPLTWIEQRLAESNQTIDQMVQSENQQQAADQVSISNSISSLRVLGAIDWRDFVESTSIVERILREDPAGAYSRMDFGTRDRYRHVVERLARSSPVSEVEVARNALRLASEAGRKTEGDVSAHVGFYLVDEGLPELESAARVRLPIQERISKALHRSPLFYYLGSMAAITLSLAGGLVAAAYEEGAGIWFLVGIGVLSLFAMSQLALALVNWMTHLLVKPHSLPRIDFSKGIPSTFRTLVVVPTMLTRESNVADLIEALEVRFLANPDDNLSFGLLTDFQDADQENLPQDEPLLQVARRGIEELNKKYATAAPEAGLVPADTAASSSGRKHAPFFLFHRPRRWNPQERLWMGYERKRGKLAELNALLRGGAMDAFSLIVGDTSVLPEIKYVITLDTDTQLPRESAHQFVGTMAHPLNRPRLKEDGGAKSNRMVKEGYGILQPRVATSLSSTNESRYARLFGGEAGVDPYTRIVSDVYQDLFHQGSFVGKGIYDVDAFEHALCRRFPENRVLSHDLLEGCYARAGLLSDVQLYEEFPTRYLADVRRRHRWIRGDWQLASWLLWRVPGPDGSYQPNPLSLLARWKLMDNLRRSLMPLALTLLLAAGWIGLYDAWFWTMAVIGVFAIPPLISLASDLLNKQPDISWRQHLVILRREAGRHSGQILFNLACLPYEAYYSLDAIIRTHFRLFVTHRQLLEWSPSHDAGGEQGATAGHERTSIGRSFRIMWIAPALAAAVALGIVYLDPVVLIFASPILLLWAGSPAVAWWISRTPPPRRAELAVGQINFLRQVARRTWLFFETFVTPEDNWLPPDNFQEHPVPTVAHRTSPTNMGLSLLANVAAYDFGYIGISQLLERTSNTLQSMETLEKYLGHFYNWYDTQTKAPLTRYISTVDSGNLAAHLLTLRASLMEIADTPIALERVFRGLNDTLQILHATVSASRPLAQFEQTLVGVTAQRQPISLAEARVNLDRLAACAGELVKELGGANAASLGEGGEWAQALATQCKRNLEELISLAPQSLSSHGNGDTGTPGSAMEPASLRELACRGSKGAESQLALLERLVQQAGEMAQMEYGFLFNSAQRQLSIGYNVGQRRLDSSYYDLLASEARLCNFVAIAQGQLAQESWFALGRMLTSVGNETALISWSGSMFEYLMPLLVMPTFDNTLLDQTYKAAVNRQIEYGRERGVPWGISESGYNAVDVHFNYQYRAFGVPGLGLKRGLGEDMVIAPYASVLGLMVAPEAACANLQRLAAEKISGKFGFYEAVDYTPVRLRRGETRAIVRSFMAHHQGMSLLSLAYLLLDRPMQRRFESDPSFQATMLLLQERIPKPSTILTRTTELPDIRMPKELPEMPMRMLSTANTPIPEVQLLSNGRYHVMVTNSGAGSSRWKNLAVTRWREDATCDNRGNFCYLRDTASGEFWSNTYQPTLKEAKRYGVIFSEGRIEFRRRDLDFDTHTEITVSPEDDIELRRLHITNRAWTRRTIEITSYAEVVLATAVADAQAPAFGNLFVQTEILPDRHAILCNRRPRSQSDTVPWMFHLMWAHGNIAESISYETDRMAFIGRGNDLSAPLALTTTPGPLSGSAGSVLDPIVSIRQQVTIEPGESAIIDIVTGAGDSRHAAMNLVDKYQDQHLTNRVFDLAWTHSLVVLRQLNATETDAQLFGRLAGSVLYANAYLRADEAILSKNQRGQSGLWGYAISGDLPIVLLQISDAGNIGLVRQLVQAHAYWRVKGLAVDLVIWNEDHSSYRQLLHDHIMGLIAGSAEGHLLDRPGGIFIRRAEQIAFEDRILLQTVARVIILDSKGSLPEQLIRRIPTELPFVLAKLTPTGRAAPVQQVKLPDQPLLFNNGLGGFTHSAGEYIVITGQDQVTPAPWANVLANPDFGSVISESGQAYTWGENAHEFRLTPWNNDPVCDAGGEAYYLRDEESGYFWSPTPLPARGATHYVTRHGFGYSAFEHIEDGIYTEFIVYVALDASVKFAVLRIRNESGRRRKLSATGCIEWVLGDLPEKSRMHVVTEIDAGSGILLARNPYNHEFPGRTAFFDADDASGRSVTGDRTEFIGRNGTLKNPAAMSMKSLSGRVGPGLDPCGAIRVPIELMDGQTKETVFRLGIGIHAEGTVELARRFRGVAVAHEVLESVYGYWKRTLDTVRVETPDPSFDVLVNGWLVYQVMASRLWGRSGFYQSGGAFGFRDQLQDVMSLVHAEPALMREHLLRAAARQFIEGDVQHWWHPPGGRGVRTRCSDDYLWLPLAVCRYIQAIGDTSVLDEVIPFLEGRQVGADEESYYDLPVRSEQAASLYDHCVRAVVHGLRFGEHGLPLMGSGDWNDGMNLVGFHGRGESVWLAFFLHEVLVQFSSIARRRNDVAFAIRCETEADGLAKNIEEHGWDGQWYLRAFFDDGSPLGSSINPECRIDSITQSWSVLSGVGAPERQRQGMDAVDHYLVRRKAGLIQLLDPPFDQSALDPGYIKGYVPGVRENGGQYTHAAIWATMAFAERGDNKRAWELLSMINPVNHTQTPEKTAIYKNEPYVVSADVYALSPHTGRGGWSWYTGSAGWLYRLMLETLLGLTLEEGTLKFKPCLPADWKEYKIHYRYRETTYRIRVMQTTDGKRDAERGSGITKDSGVTVDGVKQTAPMISLVDDRIEHNVEVRVRPLPVLPDLGQDPEAIESRHPEEKE